MKKITLLLLLPCLLACSSNKEYKGTKITLPYVEEGGLVTAVPKDMYDVAFESKSDAVFYIGDDTCSACQKLKPQLSDYCVFYHTNIFEIKFTEVKEEDLHYIVDATVGYYGWRDEQTLPSVFFFMQGSVAFCGNETDTMNFLMKYVTVEQPN